jgi:hypothetical protein
MRNFCLRCASAGLYEQKQRKSQERDLAGSGAEMAAYRKTGCKNIAAGSGYYKYFMD